MRFLVSRILCLLVLCFFCVPATLGQTLTDFTYFDKDYNDDTYLSTSWSYTFSSNPAAPNPAAHSVQGGTAKLDIRSVHFERGHSRSLYQHKLLFDMILILDNMINKDGSKYYREEGSGLTTGIIGWYSFGWNIISKDRLCVALGGNLNDYFITNSYRLDSSSTNLTSIEPQGYWFSGGPSAFADVYLNKYAIIHAMTSYSMGYWRAASLTYGGTQVDDSYPKPHFGGLSIELQTHWGAFVGLDHNWLINRGSNSNKTKRTDFLVGFKFPL